MDDTAVHGSEPTASGTDACTFCGSAATDRAFIARAPSASAAICNVCLAVAFRVLERRKGLAPSPGVNRMIGDVPMWPGERELRRVNHVVAQARQTVRGTLRGLLRGVAAGRRGAAAADGRHAENRARSSLGALFEQRVHPLATFERQCAMCGAREQLIPSPKGAHICEPCVESWTRSLLG